MSEVQKIFAPKETVNDEVVIVERIYVQEGEYVTKQTIVIDLETSKTVISIEADQDGYVELLCREGDEVKVGELLMCICDSRKMSDQVEEKDLEEMVRGTGPSGTIFSKKALHTLSILDIDSKLFSDRDFVSQQDVLDFAGILSLNNKTISKEPCPGKLPEKIAVDIVPITGIKKTEIRYLSDVQSHGLNSVIAVTVNVGNALENINAFCTNFHNSLLPVVVYEASRLLHIYKEFNAYFDDNNIVFYKDVNIGIAIDIGKGLKVVTLTNSDNLSIGAVDENLFCLIEKYLDDLLGVEDTTNSTFTITDLSSLDVDFFIPLINTRQSAVLGIAKINPATHTMYLTLTYDHRVTEGRTASNFLGALKNRIESYHQAPRDEPGDELVSIHCGCCHKTLAEDKILQGKGFVKRTNHNGSEDYICHICLSGY